MLFEAPQTGQIGLISDAEISRLLKVHPKTVARWRRHNTRHTPAARLAMLHACGLIVPQTWQKAGVRFHRDRLIIDGARPVDLLALQYWLSGINPF